MSSSSGAGGSQPSAPFSSIDPNTVSSFSSQPPQPTNGFSFGQSQSFPGATPSQNQPTQNGSAFSFGAPGGGSSFNFSTIGSASTPANPFANLSAGPQNQPSGTNGFGGFQGSMFNAGTSNNQGSNQQPLPTFGSQSNNIGGPAFGNASTGAPAPATPTTTTSAFGQPNTFGTSAPTAFGGVAAAGGGDSMETSPENKNSAAKRPLFGAGTGFGTSPAFGTHGWSDAKPAFGAPQTPSKPLFGEAKPAEQATPSASMSGGTQPASTAANPPTAAPVTTGTTTPFGAPAPAPAANPFQSSNLFQNASTASNAPQTAEEKKKEGDKPKSGFQFTPSPAAGSMFSKSENAPPAAPFGGPFGSKSALGASQPPAMGNPFAPKSTTSEQAPTAPAGNMFAPKPVEQPTTQEKPAETTQPTAQNPFGSLFGHKPATPQKPALQEKPMEGAPQTNQNPFGSLFTPKPDAVTEKPEVSEPQPATPSAVPAPSTEAPKGPGTFTPQPPAAATTTEKAPALALAPAASTEAPKVSASFTQQAPAAPVTKALAPPEAPATTEAAPAPAPKRDTAQAFSNLRPRKYPPQLPAELKADYDTLFKFRTLNESLKREIAKLDPAEDDFDQTIDFYLRVRQTLGIPLNFRKGKRKVRDEEPVESESGPSQKKVKPFGTIAGETTAGPEDKATAAAAAPSAMNIAPSSITATPSKLFGADDQPSSINRKRKSVAAGNDDTEASAHAGKRTKEASTTVNAFAQSFSNSKGPEPAGEPAPFGTPEAPPFSPLTSATPSPSPAKPLFQAPSTIKNTPTPAAPAFQIPKFGSGSTGGADFLSQFKKQSDQHAEKEKARRKAEDFDSDEDDEAEWERRDAEEQRKKREELESYSKKRAKFVPGKGFVFDDDSKEEGVSKEPEQPAAHSEAKSIFESNSNSPASENNIFSHLSATPSDVEEVEGGDSDDVSKDPSFVPGSGDESGRDTETSGSDLKPVSRPSTEASGNESDDNDFAKAYAKSKMPQPSDSAAGSGAATPSGRSLFDRIQYSDDSKPKRHEDSSSSEQQKQPGAPFGSFSSSNSTSFNNPGSTSSNVFSQSFASASSPNPFGGMFNTPKPATGSAFGASQSNDNTWKENSPIKFAGTPAKTEAAPAPDSSKPFSTLFGAKTDTPASKSSASAPSASFSFGAPTSQSSSFLAPPAANTEASRSTTPGITSDTGAESSGDGDSAETLPQVELARGGAGEENEDVLMEVRARGMLLKDEWVSQGVGFLRILKDRTTSRTRALLRADPSGHIVLNTLLIKEITYTVSGNAVQFLVPVTNGSPQKWALRVKKDEAARLGSVMEENKS